MVHASTDEYIDRHWAGTNGCINTTSLQLVLAALKYCSIYDHYVFSRCENLISLHNKCQKSVSCHCEYEGNNLFTLKWTQPPDLLKFQETEVAHGHARNINATLALWCLHVKLWCIIIFDFFCLVFNAFLYFSFLKKKCAPVSEPTAIMAMVTCIYSFSSAVRRQQNKISTF